MTNYGGLDWASEEHAVYVIDERGSVVLRLKASHTREGLREMLKKLAWLGPPQELPIAIERPNGLAVDALIEAGHPVVSIHPNVVKASRPRYRAAGGKSDPGDGYLLSDLLRTDGHRFEPLKPDSDEIKALHAKVRTRDGLVAERTALPNQLREYPAGLLARRDVHLLENRLPHRARLYRPLSHSSGGQEPRSQTARHVSAPPGLLRPAHASRAS